MMGMDPVKYALLRAIYDLDSERSKLISGLASDEKAIDDLTVKMVNTRKRIMCIGDGMAELREAAIKLDIELGEAG